MRTLRGGLPVVLHPHAGRQTRCLVVLQVRLSGLWSLVGVVVINGKEWVQELAKDLTAAFKKWLFLGTPLGSVVLRLMMDKLSVEMMRNYVLPVAETIIEATVSVAGFSPSNTFNTLIDCRWEQFSLRSKAILGPHLMPVRRRRRRNRMKLLRSGDAPLVTLRLFLTAPQAAFLGFTFAILIAFISFRARLLIIAGRKGR